MKSNFVRMDSFDCSLDFVSIRWSRRCNVIVELKYLLIVTLQLDICGSEGVVRGRSQALLIVL